jgi:hypothetical protein
MEEKTIEEDLGFVRSSLDVLITACMSGEGGGHLDYFIPLLGELRERVDRVEKRLQKGGGLNV